MGACVSFRPRDRAAAGRRRTAALLVAVGLAVGACAADDATVPAGDPSSDAAGSAASAGASSEPTGPRTVGAVAIRAATAPEWQANASISVPAEDGVIRFAQVLTVDRPFELAALQIETQGARGASAPVTLAAVVSVRLVPDGPLPERFDSGLLPETGMARSSLDVAPYVGPGPGDFPELVLDGPIDVPAGRVLVMVELRPDGASVADIELVGRRGEVDGVEDCADHNPDGMFLRIAPPDGAGVVVATAVDPTVARAAGCTGPSGPAAFNITLSLKGAVLTEAAAATLVGALPPVPAVGRLVVAADADQDADPAPEDPSEAAPVPPPAAPPPPPSAPGASDGSVAQVATWPLSHRRSSVGLAGYWWGPSAFAEVAQSLLVEEPFELTELRFGVHRVSAVANWETVPDEVIAWQHDVVWSGTIPDGRFRVTIWPLDGPGGETLDMAGVTPITQQMTVADIPIAGYAGNQSARLRLATPVPLAPGHYLVSLGIDGFGDPNAFNLYVIGRSYGYTDQTGYFRDQGSVVCDYPAPTSDYPHGRAYARVFSVNARPTLLANATTIFREHRAKVLSESLNACRVVGEPDYFLPGDLELTLVGR